MGIPEMYLNIKCDDVMLPFFITGAPNIYDHEYMKWLFGGGTRKTLTCTGPITRRQIDILRHEGANGELLYKKHRIEFENSYLTDILEREETPILVANIVPRFHRPYEEYILFYFLLSEGLGGRRDIV